MCIHGDSRFAEGGVEQYIRCFASDTRQRLQGGARCRDLATMQFEQQLTGLEDVARLGVEKADSFDVSLKSKA